MFPNLPDTFPKMIVYISIGLILVSGYFYVRNLDKLEILSDQLADQKIEYVNAVYEDTASLHSARKSLIDLERLSLLAKDPRIKEVVKDGDFRETVYIELLRSNYHPDSVLSLFRRAVVQTRRDIDTLMRYSRLGNVLKAKIEGSENKMKINRQRNRVCLWTGIAGLPLLLFGLIRWHRTDSKSNALLDVEIGLKKLELEQERKKQPS
jgi:hypothetical protein